MRKMVWPAVLISGIILAAGMVFVIRQKTVTPADVRTGGAEEVFLTGETPSGVLELYSWWADEEGPALDALIDVFKAEYPDVKVVNATITGGSGGNAKAVLKTRMLGGDPPESFQVHAGQELIGTWVAARRMLDLTPLFEAEGWMDVFPADLINLIGTDEGIWSVPVNIHKSNVMWYVPANLEKWGVEPPVSWDEFFRVAEKLKGMGVVPLSLGQTWTASHLWESVALGVLGADDYDALWAGKISWTDPKVIRVWETFGRVLSCTNTDAASLSWQEATDMVVSGQAAFNVMGDWADGYLRVTLKQNPETDYMWANPPETAGSFMFLADSFGFPKGSKNEAATLAWLKVCGSKEGADVFNPLKGSISARKDSDLSLYGVYSRSAFNAFQKERIVGSLAHGVVANEGFMNDFSTVMEMFLKSLDPGQAANACQAIAIQNGMGQ